MASCSQFTKISTSLLALFSATMGLISFIIITVFCKQYLKQDSSNKIHKHMFIIGLIFFIIMTTDFVVEIPRFLSFCNPSFGGIWNYIHIQLYSIQQQLILCILFYRVYIVFEGTFFQLSKKTIYTYGISQTTIFCIAVAAATENAYVTSDDGNTFVVLYFLAYVIFTMSIIIFYLYKLTSVYKILQLQSEQKDDSIISAITKTTILTAISTLATFIVPVAFVFYFKYIHSDIARIILLSVGFFDVITNFVCVVVSYQNFNGLYKIFCGCVDKQCRLCWKKCTNIGEVNNQMTQKHIQDHDLQIDGNIAIQSMSSKSSKSSITLHDNVDKQSAIPPKIDLMSVE